jgi:fructokinase
MNSPGEQLVIGIGELLWDCFPNRRLPGGAPANVAFHAAQLGHPARIASRIGKDALGVALRQEMESRAISTALLQTDGELPTGRVTIDDSDPTSPDYLILPEVAWEAIELDDALETQVGRAAAICVGTLAQRAEQSRRTIQRCLELAANTLRVYDLNLRRDGYRRDWIVATLHRVQILKLNLDEVRILAAMLPTASDEPIRFAKELLERYALDLVCITRGDAGSLIVAAGEIVDTPGQSVEVEDSVGAGDAFTAALISARLRGWHLGSTARLANALGALVAARPGAMPDLRREISELLQREAAGSTASPEGS